MAVSRQPQVLIVHCTLTTLEITGKLQDLGNTILGKFGMSTDDFECKQDPTTGSYSIDMKQKN